MVKNGDFISNIDLYEGSPTNKINILQLYRNKKIAVFGVIGAFAPACSTTHVPGYISKAGELKKHFADIICISVNDPFVMEAWGLQLKTKGKIRMLADPLAEFTKSLNLQLDIPAIGVRSKRYSMIVDNGKVRSLQVEPDGAGLSCSLAEKFL